MNRSLYLVAVMLAVSPAAAAADHLLPRIDGDWWQIAGDPDLGESTSPRQQPVDFGVWQAADGTWQLWSCIRHTKCGGNTRLFYRWEGKALTDRDWTPRGIAMEADPSLGESKGGLQAPHVIRVDDTFYMFYGDWKRICLARSEDGKNFTRVLNSKGQPALFSGPYENSRDPMVLKIGDLYYCYYMGHRKGAEYQSAIFCRSSHDLREWSEAMMVSAGGVAVKQTNWYGGDAECPFVYEKEGLFYLFRNQLYGEKHLNTQYASPNPLGFGVGDDRYRIGTLPAAAPEIVHHEGQDYIAALLPSLKGIRIAKLAWRKRDRGDPVTGTRDDPNQEIDWPSPDWPHAQPAEMGLDPVKLEEAKRYALRAGGSGMIVRHGKVVLRWGDQKKRYDIKSATKSFGATMLGVAMKDGKIELNAPARRYHPTLGVPPASNTMTGWLGEITILHLATQTAGFEKPGGYEKLLFKPGTQWHYSDGGPNWLAECITRQYRRDLEELMFERVFSPLGITREDLRWRNNQYREHEMEGIPRREFGAGIHANVEALSRLGYLYLHDGRWKNEQLLPDGFVKAASRPAKSIVGLPEWSPEAHGNASDHYSLLWWNNADGALESVPRGAYWAWGLYDSLIVVIPSLDMVVVRGGERGKRLPRKDTSSHYDVLGPLLAPIVAAARSSHGGNDKPGQ